MRSSYTLEIEWNRRVLQCFIRSTENLVLYLIILLSKYPSPGGNKKSATRSLELYSYEAPCQGFWP